MTSKNQNIILFGLRPVIVFVYLYHGLALDFEMAMCKFESMGFAGFLGPIIGWVEVIGALLILVGFQNRWANLLLASVIMVAIVGVQLPKGTVNFKRSKQLRSNGLILVRNALIYSNLGPVNGSSFAS